MLFRTHFSAAILTALWIEPAGLSSQHRVIYFFLVVLGALLPDLDHPNSTIGRVFPATSWITNRLFKHRGIVHSIYIPPILWWIAVRYVSSFAGLAILIGMISHLACDCLTKEGIRFFYPLSTWHLKGFVKTGGLIEKILFFLLIVGIGWKIF